VSKVKRAAALIKTCKERLKKTEDEVKKVLAEIDEGGGDDEVT